MISLPSYYGGYQPVSEGQEDSINPPTGTIRNHVAPPATIFANLQTINRSLPEGYSCSNPSPPRTFEEMRERWGNYLSSANAALTWNYTASSVEQATAYDRAKAEVYRELANSISEGNCEFIASPYSSEMQQMIDNTVREREYRDWCELYASHYGISSTDAADRLSSIMQTSIELCGDFLAEFSNDIEELVAIPDNELDDLIAEAYAF